EGAEFFQENIERIKGAFEATAGAAVEFALSNERFAGVMGISTEKAAGLSAALQNSGSSTEAYESIALRLEHSLRSAGGASDALKNQFKDANGHFLTGGDLMDRLQEVTGKYAGGAARTSVEVALLGKNTAEYQDVAKATTEAAAEQTEIYKRMGITSFGLDDATRKLDDATGNLSTTWKAEKILIGQELTPAFTALFDAMGQDGPQMAGALGTAVKVLGTAFIGLKAIVVVVAASMAASLMEVWDGIKIGGELVNDVITGQWKNIGRDFHGGIAEMKNDWTGLTTTIDQETKGAAKEIDALWAKKPKSTPAPHPSGGQAAGDDLYAGKKGPKDNSDEEALKAAEAVDLERIALAKDTNAHLLAMGKETTDAYIADEKRLADAAYAEKADDLSLEIAAAAGKKAERTRLLGELALLEQTHKDEIVRIDQEAESKQAEVAKAALADANAAENESLAESLEGLKRKQEAGTITYAKMAEQEILFTRIAADNELQRLDDEIATLTVGTQAYDEAMKAREKLAQKFSKDESKIKDDAAKEQRAKTLAEVQQGATALSGPFKTAIADMIGHGKSFGDSMKTMFLSIADNFAQMTAEIVDKWAVAQITNALLASSTAATSGAAQISTAAGVGAANAASSQAGIPIVGPVLAIAAATAMEGFILGLSSLAHASGGMVLDQDQLVYAHAKEMILPAHLSQGVQNIIASGGAGGKGGSTFHYAPTVHAPQSATLDQMLRSNGDTMRAWIKQQTRDGKL
ncbi:MAG TPA: hypothetical protein VGL62_14930, partial [Vicinamibacterales bacterium]